MHGNISVHDHTRTTQPDNIVQSARALASDGMQFSLPRSGQGVWWATKTDTKQHMLLHLVFESCTPHEGFHTLLLLEVLPIATQHAAMPWQLLGKTCHHHNCLECQDVKMCMPLV
jgi:hypothetical protein